QQIRWFKLTLLAKLWLLVFVHLAFFTNINADIKTRNSTLGVDADGDETNELTLTSVGLGVGISSPTQKLHVSGNMSTSTTIEGTTLTLTGSSYFSGTMTIAGNVVVNESGNDADFRVEGDNETHLIFADASVDRVGIANSSPSETLDVTGNILISGTLSAPTIRATSQILLPDGSAASPALAFINATDTGFFQGSSGNLDIAVDGQHVVSLSSGNFTLLNADLKTDRWARRDDNTLIGKDVVGADTLAGSAVTALGYQCGFNLSTDNKITASGYRALYSLDNGSADGTTALGKFALYALTTGQRNTAAGFEAAEVLTSGNNNTSYGAEAGLLLISGNNNTAFGYKAFRNGISEGNSAFGRDTLKLATGQYNLAIGHQSCEYQSSGNYNTAAGYSALIGPSSGVASYSYNTAIGVNSGQDVTTGTNNVFIGKDCGKLLQTGSLNVAIGTSAFDSPTSVNKTVAVGHNALTKLTTGFRNTMVGYTAGEDITTGYDNTACGYNIIKNLVGGYENVIMGAESMDMATSGYFNTGLGRDVINTLTTGYANVTAGSASLAKLTTGSRNTVSGYTAADKITTGSNNTLAGYGAGNEITSGKNNTMIGRNTGSSALTGSYNIIIGVAIDTVSGDQSNIINIQDLIYGDRSSSKLGIGVSSPTETLHVAGNVSVSGNIVSLGNGFSLEGGVVVNESGADSNFRIESDINENRFYVHPASGNIGIGTNSPSANLHIVGNVHISNGFVVTGNIIPSANAIYNVGDPSSAWRDIYTNHINIISDRRSKNHIKPLSQGLDEMLAIRPVSYNFKNQDERHMGVIAQEVREVMPEMVKGREEKGLAVNYQQFVPLLVNALQELEQKGQSLISELETRQSTALKKLNLKLHKDILQYKKSHELKIMRLNKQLQEIERQERQHGRQDET
ncbi:MAG: tail fiber domain-containing protein, partial [Planctomycetes bacterium]|nr:tail fiber domain-containing protein [Planctomycetota bacterium]